MNIDLNAEKSNTIKAKQEDIDIFKNLFVHKLDPVENAMSYSELTALRNALQPEAVEEFINSLKWSMEATNDEVTLVAGNIRNFVHTVLNQAKEAKIQAAIKYGHKPELDAPNPKVPMCIICGVS